MSLQQEGDQQIPREDCGIPAEHVDPFASFNPGEKFIVLPDLMRSAELNHREVEVKALARVQFSPLDFSELHVPEPGGGGIAVSHGTVVNRVLISVQENGSGDDIPLSTGKHLALLFKHLVGRENDAVTMRINSQIPHTHGGFGSNASLNTAVLFGLNELYGKPYTLENLYWILTHNYVEVSERDSSLVRWEFSTGASAAAQFYGGFVMVDRLGGYVGSLPKDPLYIVVAYGDRDKMLKQEILEQAQTSNSDDAGLVAYVMQKHHENHGPALLRFHDRMAYIFRSGDLDSFLQEIWGLNKFGSIKMAESFYGPTVLQGFTETARETGALYAGMSTSGPSMFALADDADTAQRLMTELKNGFSAYFSDFLTGKAGGKIEIESLS